MRLKSVKIYVQMLGFVRPYTYIFVVSVLLSVVIVTLEGTALWFVGTAPKVLFNPGAEIITKPQFSLINLNQYFKFWTYTLLLRPGSGNPFTVICIFIAAIYTAKNILLYVYKILTSILNLNVIRDIRDIVYSHVLMLPVSYYDRNKSGRIVSYIVNDITQINKSLTNTLSNLIMEPLLLCFFWGMLLVINFKLTIIIMVVYPLFFYVIAKIGSSVKRRSRRMLENFSGMMGVLTETIQGVRLVKMFNMNAVETDKFSLENRKFIRSSYKSEKAKALLLPLTETLAMYFTAGLLWFGGSMALAQSSRFTPGDFIRFLVFLFSSYQPIKRLGTINNTLQEGIAAAERVFTLMRVQPEKLHATGTAKTPSFERELRFENVSFKYPGCKDFVLQNIDFTVPKGMVIAIVGSSGAGKSTILDLLPRFYDVTQGAITIDGKNIRDMHLVDLRNLFGIVSQETILFNDTVKNNISYGTVEASMEAIVEAAAAANAMEFIEKLPERIDTIIGEQGVMLSGGQRQRLSIARALLRNPRILILDEATSSLDTESERLVQAAIDALIRNRTTFVVAHRLSTIRHADMIIVLDGGKIVEQGSHEELIAMNKRYKYFYDIQFASK